MFIVTVIILVFLFVYLFCGFVCLFVFPYTALHSTDTALPILVDGSLFEHEIMFFSHVNSAVVALAT